MSLPNILLSLLRTPMSGTDLIGLFRSSMQHFWTTDLSQIYRALEALERDGCLVSHTRPSARGPARRVYSLTDAGRQRIVDWIQRDPVIPGAKFEYLAQMFSVSAVENPSRRAREMLASMRNEAARAVGVLQTIDTIFRETPGYPEAMPAELFFPWLTLRHGLLRRKALLDWIDEALALLERRPAAADDSEGASTFPPELVAALQHASTLSEPVRSAVRAAGLTPSETKS